jgi:hypothetical protein
MIFGRLRGVRAMMLPTITLYAVATAALALLPASINHCDVELWE